MNHQSMGQAEPSPPGPEPILSAVVEHSTNGPPSPATAMIFYLDPIVLTSI